MLPPHGKETGLEADILMEPQVMPHVERRGDIRGRLFLCLHVPELAARRETLLSVDLKEGGKFPTPKKARCSQPVQHGHTGLP